MSELVLYTSNDRRTRLDLRAKNIFGDGELSPEATVRESLPAATDGKRLKREAVVADNEELRASEVLENDPKRKGGKE